METVSAGAAVGAAGGGAVGFWSSGVAAGALDAARADTFMGVSSSVCIGVEYEGDMRLR
jgi:hypothetical protein